LAQRNGIFVEPKWAKIVGGPNNIAFLLSIQMGAEMVIQNKWGGRTKRQKKG
jgi:hypothetical protein